MTNPQALNRFSYVGNNPIRLTDPSGHKCVGDLGECLDDNGKPINGANNRPDKPLTKKGEDMKNLYKRWKKTFGDITEQQFFGWMMYFEMSGLQNNKFIYNDQIYTVRDMMVEIVARQLWADASGETGGHAPYCTSSNCVNGLFNFLGEYAEVAIKRLDDDPLNKYDYPPGYQKDNGNGTYTMLHGNLLADAGAFAHDVLNPNPEWKTYGDNSPYHWGNWDGNWHGPAGSNDPQGVIYSKGTFVLTTQAQDNCHLDGRC